MAIVCALWLTGFDVKCLATMYLDKPMQGHTLMQAIARVNRVGGGKKRGLVIDYNGVLKSLRKALATFAQGDRGGTGKGEGEEDTVRDDGAARGFAKQELLLTAVNLLGESTERRKTYQVIVEVIQARYRALFPNPGLFTHDVEEGAVSAMYNKLQEARTAPDVSALLQSLYDVVDTALTTDGGRPRPALSSRRRAMTSRGSTLPACAPSSTRRRTRAW